MKLGTYICPAKGVFPIRIAVKVSVIIKGSASLDEPSVGSSSTELIPRFGLIPRFIAIWNGYVPGTNSETSEIWAIIIIGPCLDRSLCRVPVKAK